jgi:mono/diheme cytochrome c family protein
VTAGSSAGSRSARARRAAAAAALLTSAVPAAANAAPDLPQVHYMLHCQGCHLADGSGSPGKVPALRGSVAQYLTIPDGREFIVRVPGVSQAPLDDAELAAVLNWVVGRFGPPDAAGAVPPYTADEVARARRPALTDVTTARSELRRRLGLE